MRIRKRKVPLPLSLLSPVPLSDPNLFSRSPVMVTLQGADYTSASDLRRLIVANTTDDTTRFEGGDDGIQASNDVLSNASITTTTTTRGAAIAVADLAVAADDDNNNGLLSLSNNKGRWCDGDKAIPLKKRRGISFNNDLVEIEHSSTIIVDDKKLDAATLTKRNLKEDEQSTIHDDNNNNNNNNSNANVVVLTSAKKSNSKRGNTIMEGSRCSRVNGRGWRCCQPTLVGYSLCEHHLGKGRLRSMTSSSSSTSSSLKSRAASKKKINSLIQNNTSNFALGRVEKDNSCDNEKSKLERMSSFGNKRVKLGVVKARSLSSLLGQTNTMSKIVGDESMQQHQDHY